MTQESQQDNSATRRGVLLGVGLAGVGGVLAGCSTAPVPYDAINTAGQAPGTEDSPSAAAAAAGAGASGESASGGSASSGTLLASTSQIPVGGGVAFVDQKVVVTQPTKGDFKAFSAVCTHVGCICNKVANGTIDCPCHGSTFKITNGAVVTGPAELPLPPKKISVTDGKIMLLD